MKQCTKCKESKHLDSFSKFYDKKSAPKDGLQSWCKACCKIAKTLYRHRVYAEHKQYNRNWWKSNRAKGAFYSSKRRATVLNATPKWLNSKHIQEISDIYTLASELSWLSISGLHVDHIIPLRGKNVSGLHVPWNLQIIPAEDNQSKGNR